MADTTRNPDARVEVINPESKPVPITGTIDVEVSTVPPQVRDIGNSSFRTAADGASTFTGTPINCTDEGYIAQQIVVASNVAAGLGGTVSFHYRDDDGGVPAATGIDETRPIDDFEEVRPLTLQNQPDWFWLSFTPDRALVGAEYVLVSTVQWRVVPPAFVRLANQSVEEQNTAMGQTIAFLLAFDEATGKSFNVRPDTHGIDTDNLPVAPLSNGTPATFTVDTGTDEIVAAAHGLVDGDAIVLSTDGTLPDPLSGLDADGLEVAYWALNAAADPDRFQVTTNPNPAVPVAVTLLDAGTGTHTYQQRGQFLGDWKDWSQVGHGLDFFFDLQRPAVLRSEWSASSSGYSTLFGAQLDLRTSDWSLRLLEGTVFGDAYVGIGVVQTMIQRYRRVRVVNGPADQIASLYATATFLGRGSYPGTFLSLEDDITTLSTALLVRNVPSGYSPDGLFLPVRIQGRNATNSTSTLLGPGETWRGIWYPWQERYKKMALDLAADVPGTLFIDLSEDETPVNGDESSLTGDEFPIAYDPDLTPLFRRHVPVQSRWVRNRYTNGPIPQGDFDLDTAFLDADAGLVLHPLGQLPRKTFLAGVVQSTLALFDENDDPQLIVATPAGSIHTAVAEHLVETPVEAKHVWDVRGVNVSKNVAVRLPMPPVEGIGTVSIQNEGTNDVFIARSEGNLAFSNRRRRLYPALPVEVDVDEEGNAEYWSIGDPLAEGAVSPERLDGDTATGGTDPTNALLLDGSVASVAAGDVLAVSGYSAQRLLDEVSQVVIGIRAMIAASSPAFETVAFAGQWNGTCGDVGSISTTGNVTADPDWFYKADIARRDGDADVNSVAGLGLTWAKVDTPNVLDIVDDSGDTRIDTWIGTGVADTSEPVVAIFSENATNGTIKVTAWDKVDLADPVYDAETLGVAGSSNNYSDSLSGIDKGMAVTAVTSARRVHTPGSGFTELTKVNTGTGTNDSRLSVSHRGLVVTGAQTYSGTFSANANWVLTAMVLRPRPVENPLGTLRYEVDGVPGLTELEVEVSTDVDYPLNVTADRDWTFDDVDDIEVFFDRSAATSVAIVEVDHVFVDEEEADTDATSLVTSTVVAESDL